ncbi:uncharacterized protein LOC127879987 isoform X2 [Dreissena polymorpha]|uniref:Uncharacterized protein n=1 Tax=Dreissena polymorpha TaxID=45954 RepID=A0A9D4QMF4_DREPO|nr:uncharacterized protein LOC127879987 isoform X2 [Dreissena polymorpha]KAH3835470.1 hypothetical protein DPMN_108818 [Dreissena polymorpha]
MSPAVMMLRGALCIFVLVATVYCLPTEIEAKSKCGSSFKLTLNEDYRLISKAVVDTNDTCTIKFTSVTKGDCKGTCYMFDHYAEITDENVILNVGKKSYQKGSDFSNEPTCIDDVTVDVALIHAAGFTYNETYPNYKFKLNVYNKCGPKGKIVSLTFEEATREVDGYHHGKERESREKNQYIVGILTGFGLALCFLILLGLTHCYKGKGTNSGSSRSALPTHPDKVAAKPLMSGQDGYAARKA